MSADEMLDASVTSGTFLILITALWLWKQIPPSPQLNPIRVFREPGVLRVRPDSQEYTYILVMYMLSGWLPHESHLLRVTPLQQSLPFLCDRICSLLLTHRTGRARLHSYWHGAVSPSCWAQASVPVWLFLATHWRPAQH